VLVMNLIQLAGLLAGDAVLVQFGTLGWVLLVYPTLPSVIFALTFTRGGKNGGTVPGAADNLSACALVVAMCRFLTRNPAYIPETPRSASSPLGARKPGTGGRYVQRHLEAKRLEARLLNYETIAHPEIAILTSETNGTVKNSPAMVKSVVAAAQRAGVPYKVQPATLGTASDAGPFSRAGIKATTLLGFKLQQMVAFYHQERDRPGVLSIELLQRAEAHLRVGALQRGEQLMTSMNIYPGNNNQISRQYASLGFWSAMIMTIDVIFSGATASTAMKFPSLISGFILIPVFLFFMACIHEYSPPDKKFFSRLGYFSQVI
jgi:hypothetical protein